MWAVVQVLVDTWPEVLFAGGVVIAAVVLSRRIAQRQRLDVHLHHHHDRDPDDPDR